MQHKDTLATVRDTVCSNAGQEHLHVGSLQRQKSSSCSGLNYATGQAYGSHAEDPYSYLDLNSGGKYS